MISDDRRSPPRLLDLGNGEAMAVGTAADLRAAADYLDRHYPDGVTGPRSGPYLGPVLNMGHDLYRMVRDSVLPVLTPGEQTVVLVLADICMDKTRKPPQGMDASKRVCEDLGISRGTLGNILARLASRGLEIRVPIGKDKRGRLMYAAKGHAVDYEFPILAPRAAKGPRSDGALEPEPVDNQPETTSKGPRSDGALGSKVHALASKGPLLRGPLPPETPTTKDDPESRLPVSQPEVEVSQAPSGQEPDIGGNGHASPRTAEETAAEYRRQADALSEWMRQRPEAIPAAS